VGYGAWFIWKFNRKGKNGIPAPERVLMPPECLWNPQAMAERLTVPVPKGKVLFLLSTAQTVVRLTGRADAETDASAAFPFGDQSDKYVFGCNTLGDTKWLTAVPANISDSLVEMCRIKGIRPGRIAVIDTLEYRMAEYFGKLYGSSHSPLWLLIPQEPGIRLVVLEKGVPQSSYFFSNAPDFRYNELLRIWLCQSNLPMHVIVLAEDEKYRWLREFFEEKSVELLKCETTQNFKKNMMEEWANFVR